MAIFEKKYEHKIEIDDTEQCTVKIETHQNIQNHTEYVLKVQRGPKKENSWRVLRRYNEFAELHKCLQISSIPGLVLPGKKLIGNMQPEFIAQRQLALQEYINFVLMNPILASSLPTKKFIDPDTYTIPFHDLALQYASMCLRTEGMWAMGTSLGPIGWRVRKQYFKVTEKSAHKHAMEKAHLKHQLSKTGASSKSNSVDKEPSHSSAKDPNVKEEYVLSWAEYGPDKYVEEKEIHNVFKNLSGIQHPYIQTIECLTSNDSGALVVRKFFKQGSLKDLLCGSSPINPFLAKYGSPKGRSPLPLKELAMYGRQILEALRFLHSKGLPHGHVHAGNVIIQDGVAKLLDIENFILGLPSFYRPFFIQHGKISNFEGIDVYSFGHLLFEMSMGFPLQESLARQITDCPESLKNLLDSILTRDAFKQAMPTLDQLASHHFFTEYARNFNESHAAAINHIKPHLKISNNAKDQIKLAIQKTESRIRDEQKSVKNQKRLVRVQELMTSEEGKKKEKQKAREEHRQAKLRAQNSLQLPTHSQPIQPEIARSDSTNSVTSSPVSTPPPTLGTSGFVSLPSPLSKTATQNIASTSTATVAVESIADNTAPPRTALLDSICKFNRGGLRKINST